MSLPKRILPLLDRVLIQKVKPVEKTASGILIPEKAQQTLNMGTVVSVGPGAPHPQTGSLTPMNLKKGDQVVLPSYGGTSVKVGEEEMYLFRENEILAKCE